MCAIELYPTSRKFLQIIQNAVRDDDTKAAGNT